MHPWISFVVVIVVQFLFAFFVAHIRQKRATRREVFLALGISMVFGIAFDTVFGRYLSIFDYKLGFSAIFLLINGIFSYGAMGLTLLFLRDARVLELYMWSVGIGALYELANYLFSVWQWTFMENSALEASIVIFVAYFGFTLLVAASMRILGGVRFKALDF